MKLWIAGFEHPFIINWRYNTVRGCTVTTCSIRFCNSKQGKDDYDVEIKGTAKQNKLDVFEKEVGRKLSLKRALEIAGFSREERGQFWRAYFLRLW